MRGRLLLALCLSGPLAAGCATLGLQGVAAAGVAGAVRMAPKLELLRPEYLAGGLIAYAIFDPLAPTWEVSALRLDEERVRFELRMKSLISGGDGEARQVFARNARQLAESGGFAGYEVIRFEEGIDSTRPFARRVATGEVRLARSRIWPDL
jgi:hypothetical protein